LRQDAGHEGLICCAFIVAALSCIGAGMLRLISTLIVTLVPTTALAAATAWQDIAPGARARMVSSDIVDHGWTTIGLEIEMPSDTVTYWRVPGEAGIATELDFSGTTGMKNPLVDWPYPQIDTSNGIREYVYRGHLVLPVRFAVDAESATLGTSVTMGVCSDVCVPARAKFVLPIVFGKKDRQHALRLEMAEAEVPIRWDGEQEPFGPVGWSAAGITLGAIDPSIDPNSIIADVGDPALLFGAPQKSPDKNLWTLPVLGGAGTKGLEGRPVQLTFTTPEGPYWVSSVIGAAK
jgi:hypothetical protein